MLSLSVRALLCGAAAVALVGCATGRGAQTSPEPSAPRAAPLDLKGQQEAQGQEITRLAADLKAMDAQQAFLVSEIKNLNEQVAKLQSSLSEAEGALRSARATPVTPESRPAPAAAPPPPVPVPLPLPTLPPRLAAAAAAAAASSGSTAGGSAAPTPAAPGPAASAAAPPAPVSRNAEADRVFAAALAKLRAGDDGQAALEFTEFVAQFPTHPQAAAAQNHIGEAYYRQRDYRQAMAEYQKTVDGYTQAAQVSEALLKIGQCQRSLGDAAKAKASFEQVVKQFPKSDAARQARAYLGSRASAGK